MYYLKGNKEFKELDKDGLLTNERHVAMDLFRQGRYAYEESIIQWAIQNYGDTTKRFIDIGAHIGVYSWKLAPHFKKVHSFEPNTDAYNCMCANIFLKDLSYKIKTYNSGISDRHDSLIYYDRGKDGGGNGFEEIQLIDNPTEGQTIREYSFEVNTLDSYVFNDIGLIKIDVEGHELSVFKGAVQTIERNNHPPILFESWNPGEHPSLDIDYTIKLRNELFKYVKSIGYKVIPVGGWSEIFIAVNTKTI